MSNRLRIGIVLAAGLICLSAIVVFAADSEFAGKWKGETKVTPPPAPPAGGAATAGGPALGGGAAPAGGGAPAPGGGGGGRGGGGGGGGRGGGGGFGGFGGGGGPAQKVQMNLKVGKDGKVSGNITIGETTADVKDGKVEEGLFTFTAGAVAQPTYAYSAAIKDGEMTLTRLTQVGGTSPGGRGGFGSGRVEYVLKQK